MLKKTAAILCLSSILVTTPSVSFANERVANDAVMMVRGVENQGITVNISPEARGQVTTEEISQIIKQAGNATNITIHRVNKKETFAPMKVSNIVKKVESRDNPTSAVQIISDLRVKLSNSQNQKLLK